MARHSRSVPWFDEAEEQHRREGDNKRGADHRRGSGVKRIREGIFENAEPHAKEGHHDESGKAPKGARKPGANSPRLGRAHN
jgi:hypothetical protein